MKPTKLDLNVFFTMLSYLTLGICGILINTFIISIYGANILGRFNFLLTLLLIISQFSVAGIHFSVLKYNTNYQEKLELSANVVSSGLILSTFFSLLIIFLLYRYADFVVKQFRFDNFKYSFITMLPSILFFSLNKILLMGLNGLNNIKGYAFFNGIRYVFLFIFVVLFYLLSIPIKFLGIILSFSEFTLFLFLMNYFFKFIKFFALPNLEWIKKHLSFGVRGMWGGALMEINTRVDIIMIGFFLSEKAVGIYSFASMIADGFSMLYYVLRNNIEPIIGNAFFKKNKELIKKTIYDVRVKYIPFILLFGIILIIFYPLIFTKIFNIDKVVIHKSWEILNILIGFNLIVSFFQPFIGFVNLSGKPEYFSIIILITILLNIILNSFLIPLLNVDGAALATGIVFAIQSISLYFIGKKFILK